jgi:riboflavin kinase / FMN adenylyltransferase
MRVYRSLSDISQQNSVIAIGVFDGVHRGHQEVLRRANEAARRISGGQSLAMTFDRHPAEAIAPRHAPMYLSSLSQKIELIDRYCPVDAVLVVPFDLGFANLTAHQFVKSLLVDRLGAKKIFVGADFRYGKNRQGSAMDLEAAGESFGFAVEVIHSVAEDGERVSSTRARALVAEGSVAAARRLLGHPFSIRGTVVSGKKLGRTIGYPTANVAPEIDRQQLPRSGIYAGYAHLPQSEFEKTLWPAAISVGVNPTTDGVNTEVKIEAYILDGFSGNLYGRVIDVEFVVLVRHEEKFESLALLVEQIGRDILAVSAMLPQ